jgi:RNA polymerase sigma-54 factor
LKPLKLQDVAEELGFNESTISRAINGKYLETEQGVFSFKEFFSNAIGNVSTAELKEFIQRLIHTEDKSKPYSDKVIHEMLEGRFGIQMVRRSIAKYRQELDIPSFKERKFLYQLEML